MAEYKSSPFPSFWKLYGKLPAHVRELADKQYALFERDPHHPSLGFARKGEVYAVEIGRSHRAIARFKNGTYFWFWIGSHEAYNKLLKRVKKT